MNERNGRGIGRRERWEGRGRRREEESIRYKI